MIRLAKYARYRNKKDNKDYWAFQGFLGVDELTKKDVKVSRRRGRNGVRFKTKSAAQNEFARLKVEFSKQKKAKKEKILNITFKEVYGEWLEERYKNSVRESTLSKTTTWFNKYILAELGGLRLDRINIDVCDKAI